MVNLEFEQNGRTYGKTGIFVLVEKMRAFFTKKFGEDRSGLGNVVSMFVALVITSLGQALQTSRAMSELLGS